MSRRLKHRISIGIVIASLLLLQVATAAHACPSSMAGAGCMGNMDSEHPGLCKAHGDAQSQLGKNILPPLLPAVPADLLGLVPAPLALAEVSSQPRQHSYYLSRLADDGAPPLFLSLQVLRI